jgi:hypothetical protein
MKEVLFYTQIAENYYDNYLLGKMRKGECAIGRGGASGWF